MYHVYNYTQNYTFTQLSYLISVSKFFTSDVQDDRPTPVHEKPFRNN